MNELYNAIPLEYTNTYNFLCAYSYKAGLSLRVLNEYVDVLKNITLVQRKYGKYNLPEIRKTPVEP